MPKLTKMHSLGTYACSETGTGTVLQFLYVGLYDWFPGRADRISSYQVLLLHASKINARGFLQLFDSKSRHARGAATTDGARTTSYRWTSATNQVTTASCALFNAHLLRFLWYAMVGHDGAVTGAQCLAPRRSLIAARYDHDILYQRGRMPPKSAVRTALLHALVAKKCSVCRTCGSAELIKNDRNVRST